MGPAVALICRNEGNREGSSLMITQHRIGKGVPLFIRKQVGDPSWTLWILLWRCKLSSAPLLSWAVLFSTVNPCIPSLAGQLPNPGVLELGKLFIGLLWQSKSDREVVDDAAHCSYQPIMEELPPRCLLTHSGVTRPGSRVFLLFKSGQFPYCNEMDLGSITNIDMLSCALFCPHSHYWF